MYVRKSSEDKGRQVKSIPDQIRELQEIAKREGLYIVGVIKDEQTAFRIGRPGFAEMKSRIESGEGNGILVWMPSRLARNPIDNGAIIYMIDLKQLEEVRTPYRVYRNTPYDKNDLARDMADAKKDSDEKSDNVKRAIKTQLNNKSRPGPAPQGYLNDTSKPHGERDYIVDPIRFPLIRRLWEWFLTGNYSVSELHRLMRDDWGYKTRVTKRMGGKPLSISHVYKILSDPFYYGEFYYKNPETAEKQLWEGSYKKMITPEEFDRAQMLLGKKGRPRPRTRTFAYTGMMKCGECDSGITAEEKHQLFCTACKYKFAYENKHNCPKCGMAIADMKNPKLLHYIYFHCTKKKNKNCTQKYVRVENLETQIDKELASIQIDDDGLKMAIDYLNETKTQEFEDKATIKLNIEKAIIECNRRLKKLNDEFTSINNTKYEIYTQQEFSELKTAIIAERADFEAQRKETQDKSDQWLELSERTFNFCAYARYHFNRTSDLKAKGEILNSLGSNLILKDQKLFINAYEPFLIVKDALALIGSNRERLEPKNNVAISEQNGLSQSQISSWLPG